MHLRNNKFKFLVALAVTVISLGWALPAEAQGDDERPPTRSTAPVSTPVSTDGPTVLECLPLAGEICPTPPPRQERIRRTPPAPRPRACIWGRIVGADHTTIQAGGMTVAGQVMSPGQGLPSTIDIGIGGDCICNDSGSEHDSYYLPADADHTPINGVRSVYEGRLATDGHEICLPRTGASVEQNEDAPVDFGPIIVWLESLNGSVCELRATDLCRTAVEELNVCESRARMSRDNDAFESCYEQHSFTGSVVLTSSDIVTGDLEENCAGVSFECSALGVNYAPVPALPADMVGEGQQTQGPSIDIATDIGLSLYAAGIRARSIEGNVALQLTLQPTATARIAPTVQFRMGYGRMNDEGGIEIRQPMRLNLGLGVQLILAERVRLDVLATTGAIMSQNTNSNGNGDGIRADRGIGAELGLSIDLNRRGQLDSGVGLVPYLRLNAVVMCLRYNLANVQAEANYIRRTSYGFGVSFGIRFGQRGRR